MPDSPTNPANATTAPNSTSAAASNSAISGLTSDEARQRLAQFGPNDPTPAGQFSALRHIGLQLANPLTIILLVASAIAVYLHQHVDAIIIVVVVALGIAVNFFQTYRSEQAILHLRERVAPTATVLRDGDWHELPRREVVPDDVVRLSSGDLVPADGLVLVARDFFVQQAAMTGESLPTEKEPHPDDPAQHRNPSAPNMVFLGTSVVSGTATVRIFATGPKTAFGDIAAKLAERPEETEFERGLRRFSSLILRVIVFMVLFILAMSLALRHNPFESLLFAVALAVGLTPEFLPMITSVILAPGVSRSPRDMTILERACPAAAAYVKIDEIPFDFDRRRVSVIIEKTGANPAERLLIAKGAPEGMLPLCDQQQCGITPGPLDEAAQKTARATYEDLSRQGFRVLAVGFARVAVQAKYTKDDERELVLAGFLAFSDPVLADSVQALAELKRDGVEVKILTGDNELVAKHVCEQVGLDSASIVLGEEVSRTIDSAMGALAEKTTVFARVSPSQKHRIILALRARGRVVGYMGDGINDAPSLHSADVGISVPSAVDVARDAADIILVEPGLAVLHRGIIEGRKASGNAMKYLLMDTSSNFGNILSMAAASVFLPFLPMLPTQILLNNFLYDLSQVTIP